MYYSLITDSNGNGIGSHAYAEQPSSLPSGEVECTQAQAASPTLYYLKNGTVTQSLSSVKAAQKALILQGYESAILTPQSFTTAAGVTKDYTADPSTIGNVQMMLAAFSKSGSVPSGFYFKSVDGTKVTMTYADLQGLAEVLGTYGLTQYQHMDTQNEAIDSATSISAAKAITW